MTTTKGQEVISNGWKRSGIYDSITLGSSKLPALDPFSNICPLMEVAPPMETLGLASLFPKELDSYRWRVDDVRDDESEWECDDDTIVCDDDDVTGTHGENLILTTMAHAKYLIYLIYLSSYIVTF